MSNVQYLPHEIFDYGTSLGKLLISESIDIRAKEEYIDYDFILSIFVNGLCHF